MLNNVGRYSIYTIQYDMYTIQFVGPLINMKFFDLTDAKHILSNKEPKDYKKIKLSIIVLYQHQVLACKCDKLLILLKLTRIIILQTRLTIFTLSCVTKVYE